METQHKARTYSPFQEERARALRHVMERRREVHQIAKAPQGDELIFYRELASGEIQLGMQLPARPFLKALGNIAMSLYEDLAGTGADGQDLALSIMEAQRID